MSRKQLSDLLPETRGHFEFESGHHGDSWLTLEHLFHHPELIKPHVDELADRLRAHTPEIVCGPLIEGGFLGLQLASSLKLPFCYTTRDVVDGSVVYKLPGPFIENVQRKAVAVVDDVVNAGSALGSTLDCLEAAGATIRVIGALAVYGSSAARIAAGRQVQLEALIERPTRIWDKEECPLCAKGIALVRPT